MAVLPAFATGCGIAWQYWSVPSCHKMGLGLKHDPEIMLSTRNEALNLMVNDMMLAELQVVLEEQIQSIEHSLNPNGNLKKNQAEATL